MRRPDALKWQELMGQDTRPKNKIASGGEPVTIGTGQNRISEQGGTPPALSMEPGMLKWRTVMPEPSPVRLRRHFSTRSSPARVIALLAGLLWIQLAAALPEDRDQPIRITADTAIRDEKQGFTVYSGNVHMIQGSLDIVADTITIYHETAEADKIVAEGKPATMQQRPAVDEPMVRARAETIEYYKLEDRVHLQVNAHITRDDGSSVTGDSIDYYIADELVKADSERSPDSKRVQVVIPSKLVREEEDKAADGPTQSN